MLKFMHIKITDIVRTTTTCNLITEKKLRIEPEQSKEFRLILLELKIDSTS